LKIIICWRIAQDTAHAQQLRQQILTYCWKGNEHWFILTFIPITRKQKHKITKSNKTL